MAIASDAHRAQSESIGVILLAGVIVLSVGAFGAFYLPTLDDGGDRPLFSIEGDTDPPNVTITHAGGDSVGAGELRLSAEVNGSRVAYPALGEKFSSGEEWSVNVSEQANVTPGSVVGVTLYHLPSESRLYSEEWVVGEEWTRTATPRSTPTSTPTETPTPTPEPDTMPPMVAVDVPNGAETLRGGETYTIEWSASDDGSGVSGVDVAYSTDGGSSWTTVAMGRSGESYDWSVPATTTQNALVRVTATDAAGNSASDRSDATFTIDADDPTVDRISPNTSAPMYTQSGQNVTVSWETSDATTGVASVTASIQNDSVTVANTTTTDGSAKLTVPDWTAEGNYSVVVEAVDEVRNSQSRLKQNAIVVDNTSPSLTLRVEDQSGGWLIRYFERYRFNWSASDTTLGSAELVVYREGTRIDSSTSRAGNQTRTFRIFGSSRSEYRFELSATDRAGNSASVEIVDESDGDPDGWLTANGGGGDSTNDAPPTASFTYSPGPATIGETVSSDASGSDDPDDGSLTYEWAFGDGSPNATGVSPDHTYDTAGTYTVTLTVTDDEGDTATISRQIEIDPEFVYALNAGGSERSYDGVTYSADQGDNPYQDGSWLTSTTNDPIENTSQGDLYRSERYGDFSYEVPVADGTYRVSVKLAETYWNSPRQRVFDVLLEGNRVVNDIDIYERAGHDHALVLNFTVTVTDGTLNAEFVTKRDNAKLSALRIDRIGAASGPPNIKRSPIVKRDTTTNDDSIDGDVLRSNRYFRHPT